VIQGFGYHEEKEGLGIARWEGVDVNREGVLI
jgi:hypothetical protein